MIPHNLIKRIELPEGYRIIRSYFAGVFDYGVIPYRSAKEAEERDDKLNSRLELRVVILDPTGTKTDTAILSWKPQLKKVVDEEEGKEDITQANEVLP